MARRNPMNQRYKKESQVGSTRRSAASAKPKRTASSGASSDSSKSGSKSTPSRTGRIQLPPETKKLQMIVFICLGVAVAISVLYLLLFNDKQAGPIGAVMLAVSYGLLFVALYLDFTKVRPVMRALRRGEQPPTKPTKPEPTTKAETTTKGETTASAESAGDAESVDDGKDA